MLLDDVEPVVGETFAPVQHGCSRARPRNARHQLRIVRFVSDLPVLGRDSLAAVADLCRRGIAGSPSMEELDGALFAAEQPAVLRGDPRVGVVATVEGDAGAYMRLLVVDPDSRGRGHGHALVRAAQADARAAGHRTLTIGSDAPFFLWPGVPSDATALLCLLERHRYARVDTNFDMRIDLTRDTRRPRRPRARHAGRSQPK